MPWARFEFGGWTRTKNGPIAFLITRRRRNKRLELGARHVALEPDINAGQNRIAYPKVADRIVENRGQGYFLRILELGRSEQVSSATEYPGH
jgi:hypothetical protein